MFDIFPVLFATVFLGLFEFYIVTAVKGISQRSKNKSPVLTGAAAVVTQRTHVTRHHLNKANAGMQCYAGLTDRL